MTTGHSYDKANGYLDAVATPELFAQLDPKDYVQLAIAYALLDVAQELASIKYTLRRMGNQ